VASLRRYTNLAATISLLHAKQITLLNPATWDDKNDAYFMAEYKRLKGAKAVLALCFAERSETYHHWRVFSHGADGVCIEFDKHRLLSTFNRDVCISMGSVTYRTVKQLRASAINADQLPFLKRAPYKDEHEFRVIYTDRNDAAEYKRYDIELDWIFRITLSPWMSVTLVDAVRKTLRSIDGCSRVKIVRSTLVNNEKWKEATSRL